MQRKTILFIIIVIFIAVTFGTYFLVANYNNNGNSPTNSNSTNFEIQGMKVEVLAQGSGIESKVGDSVTVNYVGTLEDGKKFDSSIDRNAPFTFPLGQNRVIKGFDLGVLGMKVGEKRKITIPSALGYGSDGFLMIPEDATLIYEIDLLKIN